MSSPATPQTLKRHPPNPERLSAHATESLRDPQETPLKKPLELPNITHQPPSPPVTPRYKPASSPVTLPPRPPYQHSRNPDINQRRLLLHPHHCQPLNPAKIQSTAFETPCRSQNPLQTTRPTRLPGPNSPRSPTSTANSLHGVASCYTQRPSEHPAPTNQRRLLLQRSQKQAQNPLQAPASPPVTNSVASCYRNAPFQLRKRPSLPLPLQRRGGERREGLGLTTALPLPLWTAPGPPGTPAGIAPDPQKKTPKPLQDPLREKYNPLCPIIAFIRL